MSTKTKWPVTVFYDKACTICRSLIEGYKKQDTKNRLKLVDISSPGFKAEKYGLDPELVRIYLYAKNTQNQTVRGIDAFIWVWQAIDKNLRAAILGWPVIRIIAQPLYRLFSRYRYLFSKQKREQRKTCKGACKWQQL